MGGLEMAPPIPPTRSGRRGEAVAALVRLLARGSLAPALLLSTGMRRLAAALAVLVVFAAGCSGYRQDATHRSAPSAGAAVSATGPNADPDAYHAALPRAVLKAGRDAKGDLPVLGYLTGSVLLVALGLGLYTIALVSRRTTRR